MKSDDNSVNIEIEKPRYHHGDLRAALIEAGLRLLSEKAADQFSLREVARDVGVSATAVYRHFPDKQALLFALCQRGADLLAHASRSAMQSAGRGKEGFDATGKAYVRFALANPALFRQMMTTRHPDGPLDMDSSLVSVAMQELRNNVGELLPPGASPARRKIAAIHAWSLVHGMAMLMLDGQIPADEATIESIAATID